MLRYTLMRLGIFVGCFVVVWALVYSGIAPRGLGASNGMWVVVLALLVSAPISFVALRKERDRASVRIAPTSTAPSTASSPTSPPTAARRTRPTTKRGRGPRRRPRTRSPTGRRSPTKR